MFKSIDQHIANLFNRKQFIVIFILGLCNFFTTFEQINSFFSTGNIRKYLDYKKQQRLLFDPNVNRNLVLKKYILSIIILVYVIILILVSKLILKSDGLWPLIAILLTCISWFIRIFFVIYDNDDILVKEQINYIRLIISIIEIVYISWFMFDIYVKKIFNKDDINEISKIKTLDGIVMFIITMLISIICNAWWSRIDYRLFFTCFKSIDINISSSNNSIKQSNDENNIFGTHQPNVSKSILFTWLNKVFEIGYSRQLSLDDLPDLSIYYTSKYNTLEMIDMNNEINTIISSENNRKLVSVHDESGREKVNILNRPNDMKSTYKNLFLFLKIGFKIYGWTFFYLGFIKLLLCLISFSGPLLLGQMVSYIQSNPTAANISTGLLLVFALFTSFIITAVLNIIFNIHSSVMQIKIKGALTSIVFRRSLTLPIYACASLNLSTAKLVNLVQVDVDQVANVVKSFHDLWMLPLQIIIAFLLLYQQVSIGFISGIVIIFIMIPINTVIAKKINIATKSLMLHKDKRISILTEGIKYIRSIKMCGLESYLLKSCIEERKNELIYLGWRKYLDAICVFLWASTPVLIPFAVFTTTILVHGQIKPQQVFTTIALLNMLIYPMNAFPWIINGFIEATVSLNRIINILLNYDETSLVLDDYPMVNDTMNDRQYHNENSSNLTSNNKCQIEIYDANFVLNSTDDSFQLSINSWRSKIDKDRAGGLVVIVGEVATGKSSFLLSCLGETYLKNGIINVHANNISYCPQVPVLHSANVIDNIIMGNEYNDIIFREIIQGVSIDLDIKSWSKQELTELGSGGQTISGGQRLRIGICRALYSLRLGISSIALLDDPFAALDHTTATTVMNYLVLLSRLENRTIIITTHSIHLLTVNNVNNITVLKQGKILCQGAYDEICNNANYNNELFTKLLRDVSTPVEINCNMNNDKVKTSNEDNDESDNNVDKLERVEIGKINMKVYMSYFEAPGMKLSILILIVTFLMQASANSIAFWYAYWAAHTTDFTPNQFIFYSGILVIANVVFALLRSFLFAYGGMVAAKKIFLDLIHSVFNTNINFFDSTSLGRIVNRLGKDIYCIDDSLPFMLNIVLAQVFVLLGTFVVISITDPIIILILVLVGYYYYKLQSYYRCTSRELRRLESINRSPLYSLLSDCISNGPTIRSLGKENIIYYENILYEKLDKLFRVVLMSNAASNWLSIRLQILGAIIATSLALSATLMSTYNVLPVSAGLVGISLVYSLSIVNNLNGLVGSLTETEQEMISVERVMEYSHLIPENYDEQQSDSDSNSKNKSNNSDDDLITPLMDYVEDIENKHTGVMISSIPNNVIVMENLCMKYKSNSHNILNNISIKINAGDRVAIIGKSGSGKSSFFSVLLRMIDYTDGSISIGNCELKSIPRKLLREYICAIPQEAFLFHGTIRMNLDPKNEYCDDDLYEVMTKSGFLSTINDWNRSDINNILNMNLKDNSLSQGQKQLMCLSRALLHKSKIILCDEGTSSIDPIAQEIFYQVLNEIWSKNNTTLLIITHQIESVRSFCNKVLSLDTKENIILQELH